MKCWHSRIHKRNSASRPWLASVLTAVILSVGLGVLISHASVTLNGTSITGDASFESLSLEGTPPTSSTSSFFQLGLSAIEGSANGTFIGINPSSFLGDFLNFQVASSSVFKVDSSGNVTAHAFNGVANVAGAASSSDAIQYVSASGNDSNSGLSWGTAKATVSAAITALGSASGTIWVAPTWTGTEPTPSSNVNVYYLSNPVNGGTLSAGSNAQTVAYTVSSADNGKIIPVDCSASCAVTLPAATSLSPDFTVRIFDRGTTSVTIISTSTIYGGQTILPGMYADVAIEGGSAYDSMRNTNTYTWAMTSPQASDTLTTGGTFGTTFTIFANLPAGTDIQVKVAGNDPNPGTNNNIYPSTYLDGDPTVDNNIFCAGDWYTPTANVPGAAWEVSCNAIIQTTGTSGTFWTTSESAARTVDSGTTYATLNTFSTPGGDISAIPQTIDTTIRHILYVDQQCQDSAFSPLICGGGSTVPTTTLVTFIVRINLPWDK